MIVEVLGNAQLRLAELHQPVIIYRRNDCIYVRLTQEFHSKFKRHDQEN